MRSIGRLARDSGLTISALRFYDGRGVLPADWVDPDTGYRWYDEARLADARLIARLRRVGMPLAGITAVLAARSDPAAVRHLLDGHLARLADGLADARRELSAVQSLIDAEDNTMTATEITVEGTDLGAALGAVRFAVGADPELPALAGVLLDLEGDTLRLVATDRYRLATASIRPQQVDGPQVSVIVPTALTDEIVAMSQAAASQDAPVTLRFDGAEIAARSPSARVAGNRVDQDFPDYRRLVALDAGRQVPVSAAALRDALNTGPTSTVTREQDGVSCQVVRLAVDSGGSLVVASDDREGDDIIGVNREFLLEALAAGATDQLVLEIGGPVRPLAIRVADRDDRFSLLMPTRITA